MKRALLSAAALALVLGGPALAQGQAMTPAGQTQAQQAATGDSGTRTDLPNLADWNNDVAYQGWSVDEFLGADVFDASGEEIGEVEDLIVSRDGQIRRVVIEAGGFLDIGDSHFAFPWDRLTARGPESIAVPFDEDYIDDYSVFGEMDGDPAAGRNWRVRELLNDFARVGEDNWGLVDDLIANDQGQIVAVIAAPDIGVGDGRPYAWPYDPLFDPENDYYDWPYRGDQMSGLDPWDPEPDVRAE